MKRTAIIALSLAMTIMFTSGAFAKSRGRAAGPGFAPGPQAQLTAEQQTKLREVRAAFMQETLQLRQTMANKAQELRTMMVQKDADQAKVKALAYELVDLRGQMSKKRIDHRIKIKNELGIDLPMRGFGRNGGRMGQRFMVRGARPGMGGYGQRMGMGGPGMGGYGQRMNAGGPGMSGYGQRMNAGGPGMGGYGRRMNAGGPCFGPQGMGYGPGMGGRRGGGYMVRGW